MTVSYALLVTALVAVKMGGNIVALSFIILSVCCAVPLHNNCSITSGWDEDGKALSKEDIQYCLIDNCVVRRMDTNQELDIVDVGNDTLVGLARDNFTSTMIALLPDEEYCLEEVDHMSSIEDAILLAIKAILLALSIILSLYIIIVYSLWDKLRSSIGKLLVIHNSLSAIDNFIFLILMAFHAVTKSTAPYCQTIIYIHSYLKLSNDVSISIIFVHIAYLLRQSRRQRFEISVSWSKNLLKFYAFTTFTLMLPNMCFTVLVDLFSGAGEETISSNDYCILPPLVSYTTFDYLYGYCIAFGLIQITAFILIVLHYKILYDPFTGNDADAHSIISEPKVSLLFGLALIMIISTFCSSIFSLIMLTFLTHSYTASLCLDLVASFIQMLCQLVIAVKLTMLLKQNNIPNQSCA